MNEPRTVFETPLQHIELEELPSNKLILDIGGGGEGIASRIGRQQVCAIDYRMGEIREARIHNAPSNWFACDAQQLCFRDGIFDVATLWFSLGYMRDWKTKESIMQEVYRVMRQNGLISILGSKIECKEEVFIIHILFTLPDGSQSKTGYGVKGGQGQTLQTIMDLMKNVGFDEFKYRENSYWFELLAIKI